jgi:hypothetical protein
MVKDDSGCCGELCLVIQVGLQLLVPQRFDGPSASPSLFGLGLRLGLAWRTWLFLGGSHLGRTALDGSHQRVAVGIAGGLRNGQSLLQAGDFGIDDLDALDLRVRFCGQLRGGVVRAVQGDVFR